ncbi:MAG: hypothetical protein GEU92_15875 [Alphaproteobacteria bacterium]|nr:hypothetical protein [Alphaproteobacteria bacterium]
MNVGSYVDSARTISLVVIVLGYIGWDIGTHHSQRAAQFAAAREMIAADWMQNEYRNDRTIIEKMLAAGAMVAEGAERQLRQVRPFEVASPVGDLAINMQSTERSTVFAQQSTRVAGLTLARLDDFRLRFRAEVKGPFGTWSVSDVAINDPAAFQKLARFANDLDIEISGGHKKMLGDVENKLYRRKVSVPNVEFAAFHSEKAVWLVTFLCVLLVVILRSRVRLIRLSPDAGLGTPWLVLDASTVVEKIIATLWVVSIVLAGWLACGAVLFTEKDLLMATATPPQGRAALVFLSILALATVSDLLKLRDIRITRHSTAASAAQSRFPGPRVPPHRAGRRRRFPSAPG